MREWDEEVSLWVARIKPEPAREARLVREVLRRLDDHYLMLLSQGATEQEAYRTTLAALDDGRLFATSLRRDEPRLGATSVVFENGRRKIPGDLWRNLRYGMRMLVKAPNFSLIAVLTLGLGIGATTAIFSVVYATLFEPMPYPKPDQLMMVWTRYSEGRGSTSVGDYLEWKRRNTSFQYLQAWTGGSFNVATQERPEQVVPYYQQLLGRIEAVAGVEKATVTTGLPTRGAYFGMAFTIVGAPPVDPSARPGAGFQMVTPGFFETFGIRMVKGNYANTSTRHALRRANAFKEPKLHVDRLSHIGARHRREHGDLQCDQCGVAPASSIRRTGTAGGDLGK